MKRLVPLILLGSSGLSLAFLLNPQNTLVPQTNQVMAQAPKIVKPQPKLLQPGNKETLIRIPSQVKGVLTKVLVKKGQSVKKGDLLVQLEDGLALNNVKMAKAHLAIAQAELKSTEATLKEAEQQLQRVKMLPKTAVSQEEIRVKQLTFERYKYETEARKQGVQLAQLNLEHAEIKASMYRIQAPADGTILRILKQPGEAVGELEAVLVLEVADKN